MNIALIAHDAKKELMVQFCIAYCGILSRHSLCATGTTGKKGFTKPAGFSKQAPPVDDAEEQKPSLVVLIVSIIGLILALTFCWFEYETDQTPDRITNSERIFGDPAATGGGEAADSGESDGGSDEGAAEEESEEE